MVEPSVCWVPPAVDWSAGVEAVELAASVGLMLDEWQQLVVKTALARRPDGKWAAFEVGMMLSRQNGKGGVLEALELAGLFLLGEEMILHSAHQFDTSMEAYRRLRFLIEESDLHSQVKRYSSSHGEEGIELLSRQRIRFNTRTRGGRRGFSADRLIFDEAMDLPEAVQGAVMPTLSARPNPQVMYAGSAVDQMIHEHGVVFARIRERGHAGGDSSLAYLEWSAAPGRTADGKPFTPDHADALLRDRSAWRRANPAIGIRISEEYVENERKSLGARSFAVERLGVGDWPPTTIAAAAKLNLEKWAALADEESLVLDPVRFAFDVTPDRSFASVGVAGRRPDGLTHLEVVEYRKGTAWVPEFVQGLLGRHPGSTVGCDAAGPAGALLKKFENLGVDVDVVTAREMGAACGLLYDGVEQRALRHLGQPELDAAVEGAATRPLGDAWAWARKSSVVDISPLVSVTIAGWYAAVNAGPSVYEEREILVV